MQLTQLLIYFIISLPRKYKFFKQIFVVVLRVRTIALKFKIREREKQVREREKFKELMIPKEISFYFNAN